MAIKGKGKTRARQPVRAPRRGPVPVPVPFVRRRGVQVAAAFLAGLLVFWGGIWLTNGLREQDRSERNAEEELLRRRAGSAWENLVATEVGAIGTLEPGRPPVLLPQVRATVTGLADETPEGAVRTLRDAAADAREAIDGIDGYQLSGSLRDKGFESDEVLRFLSARDEMVAAIELYRQAALLGALAADLDGASRKATLDRAEALLTNADTALIRFQTHQSEALAAAGIIQQPTLPGS
jgi:hypothetical protein